MASVTRSTRRAEALHPHPQHHGNAHHHLMPSGPKRLFAGAGGGRNKRPRDVVVAAAAPDRDFEAIKPKRTRISVEILARGSTIATDALRVPPAAAAAAVAARPRPAVVATVNPLPTPPAAATEQQRQQQQRQRLKPPPARLPTPPPAKNDQNLTKHQAKVANGIKHELDRLQPQEKATKEQGRKLRSQEATRFKSELSAYFPDYDEVIGNEPKEQYILNVDTPILVVDSDLRRAGAIPQRAIRPRLAEEYSVRGYGDALFHDVFDAQRIDISFLEAQYKSKEFEDPLPDKLFQPAHKRAERLERSIRNTEKGRAQHERDQIIRLLEGLQGHDWLRVMGVSGITETRKKAFEPARDHFIKGCQTILAKFRNWSLEEKRRKLEKEKALAEQKGDDESDVNEEDEEEADDADGEDGQVETRGDDHSDSASPGKQLHEEAMVRSKAPVKGSKRRRSTPQPQPAKVAKPPKPPEPPKEFKSFFSKRYERDSALNRHRRAGRKVLAWGHPIPDIPEQDFDLPQQYRDEDTLRLRERNKRREKRNSKH